MLPVTEAERIRTPPGPLSVEIIYNVTAIKHVQVIRFKTRPGILELLLHAVLPLLQAVKQLREMDFPLPLCQNVSLGTVKSQQRHADGFKPLDAITWNDQTFTSSFNHHLKKKQKKKRRWQSSHLTQRVTYALPAQPAFVVTRLISEIYFVFGHSRVQQISCGANGA